MPITSLPQQETYKQPDLFKKTLGRAYDVGRALPSPRRFRGVAGAVRGAGVRPTPGGAPVGERFRNLGPVTTRYGGSTKFEQFHPGLDVAGEIGTPIPAFAGGTVTGVQTGQVKGSPGFGNYVIVTDAQGNQHRYSHLHENFVRVGQPIGAGEQLGTMGTSGQVYSRYGGTGSHLDYRIFNAAKQYYNPSLYLSNM